MKKLIILFILILSGNCFALVSGVENTLDGGARAINLTIDTRAGSTANYYSISGTVTSNTAYDVYSYLGRYASNGYFINDSDSDVTVNISLDGATYGPSILIKTNESLDLTFFEIYKKIKVTVPATSNIRLLAR